VILTLWAVVNLGIAAWLMPSLAKRGLSDAEGLLGLLNLILGVVLVLTDPQVAEWLNSLP
jgi:hypothetical protein